MRPSRGTSCRPAGRGGEAACTDFRSRSGVLDSEDLLAARWVAKLRGLAPPMSVSAPRPVAGVGHDRYTQGLPSNIERWDAVRSASPVR